MRIVWNDTIEIVGEGRFSSLDGVSRDVSEAIQRIETLNSTEPQWASRGNHSNSITVQRWRIFDSLVDAQLFFLEHGDTEGLPNYETAMVGIVTFYCGDEPTGQAIRYANGTLKIRVDKIEGVSVWATYTLEYGRIRIQKPTS